VLLLVGGAAQVITIDRQRTIDLARLISPTNPTWWSADSPFKVMTSSSKIMHTLEHEAELFRGHIDPSNVNMEPLFAFHIAFGEPEIVKGQPVVATLHQFVNLVEGIIEPFRPLLV